MQKHFHILFAVLLTVAFIAGAYAQEKPKEAAKEKPTVKVIMTILGTIGAIDVAHKTITVRARYETEYFIHEDTILTREYVLDKEAINFDMSKAKFGGCTGNKCAGIEDLKKGDHVRVAYDKIGDAYVAHTILKIGKRGDR